MRNDGPFTAARHGAQDAHLGRLLLSAANEAEAIARELGLKPGPGLRRRIERELSRIPVYAGQYRLPLKLSPEARDAVEEMEYQAWRALPLHVKARARTLEALKILLDLVADEYFRTIDSALAELRRWASKANGAGRRRAA